MKNTMPAMPKESQPKILLVANRTLIRLGIQALLQTHLKIDHVDEVNPQEALLAISKYRPQVVIHDVDDMQGDLRLLRAATEIMKPAGWIILTSHKDSPLIRAAYAAGAGAVVLKQYRVETMVAAIEKVVGGGVWMDRAMLDSVLEPSRPVEVAPGPPGSRLHLLTRRERDVVNGIVKGFRNKRIAEELGISEVTVRHHLTAIFAKLQVSDRLGLLLYATQNGLADTPESQALSK